MKARSDGDGSIYRLHTKDCPPAIPTVLSTGGTRKVRPEHDCKGKWMAALLCDDGEMRRRTAPTKTAAATALRLLREQYAAGELPVDREPTVEEWMTYWYTKVVPRTAKPHTISGYNAKVNDYIIPLLGKRRLSRLTSEHINDAWDRLRDTGNPTKADPTPLSANTVHQAHRIMARALKVAMQRKLIKVNPAGADSMDAPPREDHDIAPMTQGEVDKVLAAAVDKPNAARWRVALAIGLRQGEALGLRWEDVDLEAGALHVRQTLMRVTGKGLVFGTPKSKMSRRTIALPASLLAELKAHRKAQTTDRLAAGSVWTDSGLVFAMQDGRPIDPSVDAKRWRSLLTDAGVRHYRLHDARHSAATMMLRMGVDVRVVQAILGHAQISMTMRYTHVLDDVMVGAAAQIDRAFVR